MASRIAYEKCLFPCFMTLWYRVLMLQIDAFYVCAVIEVFLSPLRHNHISLYSYSIFECRTFYGHFSIAFFFVHLQMRWKTHIILVAISNQLAWRILSFVEINAHYKMAMENCLRMNRNKIKKLLLFWCVWKRRILMLGKKMKAKGTENHYFIRSYMRRAANIQKKESFRMENARWWTNCALSVCMCTLHTRRNIDQINYGNCIFFCSTLLAIFLPQSGCVSSFFHSLSALAFALL